MKKHKGYAHRLEGKRRIKLADFDPGEHAGLKREDAEKKTAGFIEELIELQELLYAVRSHSVLVVLQGRDTSGKDGTIRHVAGPLDSQSCSVSSFKVPTEEELSSRFPLARTRPDAGSRRYQNLQPLAL